MHYARQCGSYIKWYDHISVATIRKPHCLTSSHTQFHAEDFLSYIYVSSRCNRPRRFGGTNNLFWKQIKKGESTNRASSAILNPYTKADPGPPPRLKKGTCFCKFSIYIRKFFDFSQHAVFTICILFTTLLKKTQGMCRCIKANLRSKNSTAPLPPPH